MKKTVVIALAAALTLSSSAVIAQAEPSDTAGNNEAQNQAVRTVTLKYDSTLQQKEISGTITEISETFIKVKTGDGQVYTVPLGIFSGLEGYDGLGLAKDVEVSLKRSNPVIIHKDADGNTLALQKSDEGTAALPSIKADIGKAVEVKKLEKGVTDAVTVASDVYLPISAEDVGTLEIKEGEKFFFASEITANGKTLKAEIKTMSSLAVPGSQVQPVEISGTVQSIDENGMTVKTSDEKQFWIPLGRFKQDEAFKSLDLKEGAQVNLKSALPVPVDPDSVISASGTITFDKDIKAGTAEEDTGDKASEKISEGAFKTGAGDLQAGKVLELNIGDGSRVIFIAGEITANGTTVKLPR